jgi:hypothetical protein
MAATFGSGEPEPASEPCIYIPAWVAISYSVRGSLTCCHPRRYLRTLETLRSLRLGHGGRFDAIDGRFHALSHYARFDTIDQRLVDHGHLLAEILRRLPAAE